MLQSLYNWWYGADIVIDKMPIDKIPIVKKPTYAEVCKKQKPLNQ